MYVYVLEVGLFPPRDIRGVFTTPESAIASHGGRVWIQDGDHWVYSGGNDCAVVKKYTLESDDGAVVEKIRLRYLPQSS